MAENLGSMSNPEAERLYHDFVSESFCLHILRSDSSGC